MRHPGKPVLLVVDDDDSVLSSLQRGLDRAGWDVRLAGSGSAAMAHLVEDIPDLVLLDVMLPGGPDGYDICRALRSLPEMEFVPIVFVTALDSEQDEAKAFSAGGSGFIRKPFELPELVDEVRRQLEEAREFQEAREAAARAEALEAELEGSTEAPSQESAAAPDEDPEPIRLDPVPQPMVGASVRQKLAPGVFRLFKKYLLSERRSSRSDEAAECRPDELYNLSLLLNLPEDQLARYVSRFLDVSYVPRLHHDGLALGVLPKAFCVKNQVLPIRHSDDTVGVILANPFNWELLETLHRTVWRDQEPKISITSPDLIEQLFSEAGDQLLRVPTFEELARKGSEEAGLDSDGSNPALLLANELLRAAVEERASDLHIEPKDRHTLVRFRIDGDMQDVRTLGKKDSARLISRFKALAGMDIAERRKPQDGSVEVIIEERRLKMRLATSATSDGETMVIRLLEPTQRAMRLEHLGMASRQVKALQKMANRHQGMILVVGPTGSGKSTTIFSVLSNVDGHTRSIMSVEDPVEYRIPFANQQEVNEKAGVTFESLLRSAMRQDPDILFLGEIRDTFSAKAALDFASSGHLTVSTLHTANATSTIFRLERLGVERGSMADSLLGIVSQKLIKRLCPHCRAVREITDEERSYLAEFSADLPPVVADPVGCPSCRETGYLGREAVNEVLQFDPIFSEMVRTGASINQLRQFCVDRGDFMIYDHAMEKVRQLVFAPRDAYELVLLEEMRFRQASNARAKLGVAESVAIPAVDPDDRKAPAPDEQRVGEPISPEVTRKAPPPPAVATEPPSSAVGQVLLAEDDLVTCRMVKEILERAGYDVTTASDGAEALLAFGQTDFDVIVSDLNMPNLDGMKLLELLVSKGVDTPVLFLTSESDTDVECHALAAGAADFIRKPVSPEVLVGRVRRSVPQAAARAAG